MTLESIIELMHGDKSNDWSEEIAALSDHLFAGGAGIGRARQDGPGGPRSG